MKTILAVMASLCLLGFTLNAVAADPVSDSSPSAKQSAGTSPPASRRFNEAETPVYRPPTTGFTPSADKRNPKPTKPAPTTLPGRGSYGQAR